MAGYTRQSVADIINGANITAPPLNAEFNQILAAFNASTGHSHDGSTGNAPKIPLTTSVSGYLPVAHGGVGGLNNTTATTDPTSTDDNTQGYAPGSMWINSATGYTHMCLYNTTNNAIWATIAAISNTNIFAPKATNTVDIGTSTLQFKDIYVDGVGYIDNINAEAVSTTGNADIGGILNVTSNANIGGTLAATGDVTVTGATQLNGTLTANGNVTFGDANTDTVSFTSRINTHVLPSADDTYDLGSSGFEWRNLYIDGIAEIDQLNADSVDIDGGSVDATVIGAGTPDAGSFNGLTATGTVNFSGATVSSLGAVSSADINGGTVDGITLGTNSAVTVAQIDNINIDGNAITSTNTNGDISLTPAGTGKVNISKADIDSGTIDNTVIGASTPVAGSFTTVATSGQATLATADINGGTIDGTAIGGTTPTTGAFTTASASGGFTGALSGDVTGNLTGNVSGNVTGNVTGNLSGNVNATSGTSTFSAVTINGQLDMNAGTTATIVNLATPTNASDAATKDYVDTQVAGLVDSAPGTLDTLNELAAALGDDPNFSTTITNEIATKLPLAGGTMSGVIAMGSNKITGVTDPTANQDASTKAYTDAQRDTRVAKSGDTMSGDLAMGSNKITGLGTPTAATDASTKDYVDTILGSTLTAATSASNAATSETNAANSASAASTSETNAASSATSAAASLDTFTDQYLGPKATAPTVDNDGDALVLGSLYFNTATDTMQVYGSTGWVPAGSSVNGTSERYKYTATSNQTTFSGADDNTNSLAYDSGYLDVYLSGIRLVNGTDFTATSGTSIQLSSPAATGDILEVVAYGTFTLANQSLTDMSDVNTGGVSTNDILAYNGTNFVPTDTPTLSTLTLSGTGSVKVPNGTTAQRDSSPVNGMFRYNDTTDEFEGYADGSWGSIGGGQANLSKDTMTGDGSTTTLTLSVDPLVENNTQVYIDGVYQSKANYSISGTTLTFTTAPPTGTAVEVITIGLSELEINVPADSSVTSAKLATNIAVSGTLDVSGAFTSLGIDDNATSTAITIDSNENVNVNNTLQVGDSSITQQYTNSGYIADFQASSGNQTYISIAEPNQTSLGDNGMILGEDQGASYLLQRNNKPLHFGTNNVHNRLSISGAGIVSTDVIQARSHEKLWQFLDLTSLNFNTFYPVTLAGGSAQQIATFELHKYYANHNPVVNGTTMLGSVSMKMDISAYSWGGIPIYNNVAHLGQVYRSMLGAIGMRGYYFPVLWLRGGYGYHYSCNNPNITPQIATSSSTQYTGGYQYTYGPISDTSMASKSEYLGTNIFNVPQARNSLTHWS